ncbi:MAG: translocation/assembly module TamB domain-containing protein, partial [Crocinitomicaceae bacterium]|nr:translocation/assembly module TamB domain-containing protein [Crocinitomicaceae bacterium]
MDDRVKLKTEIYNIVPDLKLKNFDLNFKEKTRIKGTINLDDYRDFEAGFFRERLDYTFIDIAELKTLKLPNSSPTDYIHFDNQIEKLGYFEAHGVRLDGAYTEFVLAARLINTKLGSAEMNEGILFTANEKNNSYLFQKSASSNYDVKVNNFNLGAYLGDPNIGLIDGTFFLTGEAFSSSDIIFTDIEGAVNRFEYLDYPYQDITLTEGKINNEIFEGKIDIKDDNLNLTYDGYIDFKGEQKMHFTINLTKALLDNLNLADKDSKIKSAFTVDITGNDLNNYQGSINLKGLIYTANGKTIEVPNIRVDITRGEDFDIFKIISDVGTANIEGHINFYHLLDNFNYQLSKIFPSIYKEDQEKIWHDNTDHFTYNLHMKEANDFFAIFLPNIRVAPNTKLNGHYFGESSNFNMQIDSDSMSFQGMRFDELSLHQVMDSNSIVATYHADKFSYNDSIDFDDIYFKTTGGNNSLYHELTWEQTSSTPSSIKWETNVYDTDHYRFILDPSHFYVKEHKWEIAHESSVRIDNDTINVDKFELKRNNQWIYVDGKISNQNKDRLEYRITDFELGEISDFISKDYLIEGTVNCWGYIANPFHNSQYIGDAAIMDFHVKNKKIGNIFIMSEWDTLNKSIHAKGDLLYLGNQTFDFDGDYYPTRKEESLDFDLNFDYTDLQFTNAFVDPDVLAEIKGLIDGTLQLTGTPELPILEGAVELKGGSAFIDMLGVHFGVDGPIEVDEYGFFINNIPVFDEDGNAGSLIGSVYHDNYKDFNFDLQFDLERDAVNIDPFEPYKVVPLKQFLFMDLPYSYDVLYYGKGYATGMVNIFGYTDNLEITVDVKTAEGTKVNIPMYGVGEIDEEDFIIFKDKSTDHTTLFSAPRFDFTGVDLDLNFDVTQDAEIKIIFNEELGDIITARGQGDLSISLDNLGDITMNGIYTVHDGVYDFAMGPVKQKFFIAEGGNISWTGDPYDANLALRTYYRVNANIADISNDQLASGTGAHQQILCYLNLTESMLKPAIGFDIEAPQADEIARSLINRVKSDPDELNR